MSKPIIEDIVLYSQELYLSQNYIIENADVSYNYIRVAGSRFNKGRSETWRHVKLMNKNYFAYDGLPTACKEKLASKKELVVKAFEVADEIVNLIITAKLDSFKLFAENNTFERAFALAIIHEASIYIVSNDISFSKSPFFTRLANEVKLRSIRYIPKTWRNLRDKIQEYHFAIQSNKKCIGQMHKFKMDLGRRKAYLKRCLKVLDILAEHETDTTIRKRVYEKHIAKTMNISYTHFNNILNEPNPQKQLDEINREIATLAATPIQEPRKSKSDTWDWDIDLLIE